METPDVRKLAESIEANLRDGRSLESLKRAMNESGYREEEIKAIISHVDRKKTVRRPKRPKDNRNWVVAASIAVLAIIAVFSLMGPPALNPGGNTTDNGTGNLVQGSLIVEGNSTQGSKICYVLSEEIKASMMKAGVECDEWIIIKKAAQEMQVAQERKACYVLNETIKQSMIDAGIKCEKWYEIKEI